MLRRASACLFEHAGWLLGTVGFGGGGSTYMVGDIRAVGEDFDAVNRLLQDPVNIDPFPLLSLDVKNR